MIIFGVAFVVVLYVAISILFVIYIRRSVASHLRRIHHGVMRGGGSDPFLRSGEGIFEVSA